VPADAGIQGGRTLFLIERCKRYVGTTSDECQRFSNVNIDLFSSPLISGKSKEFFVQRQNLQRQKGMPTANAFFFLK